MQHGDNVSEFEWALKKYNQEMRDWRVRFLIFTMLAFITLTAVVVLLAIRLFFALPY